MKDGMRSFPGPEAPLGQPLVLHLNRLAAKSFPHRLAETGLETLSVAPRTGAMSRLAQATA